tara:strand:+ start:47 stop:574 length:528 start_codon:yes stop_codon:yes gene_type:complete
MAKESKNLAKVQSMLDGTYGGKIQSGYVSDNVHANRKIGERWFDSDGDEWEQKEGYRSKVNKLPSVGLGDTCSMEDCKKLIIKKWDKDTYKADGRCYHCQLNYELDLQFDKPIRWFAYRRLKDLRNMKAIEKEMEQWVDEFEKIKNEKIFDKSVANALANNEIDTTNVKLTNKTM